MCSRCGGKVRYVVAIGTGDQIKGGIFDEMRCGLMSAVERSFL